VKTVALMRKQRHRGLARVRWLFIIAVALYNLVRIRDSERRESPTPDDLQSFGTRAPAQTWSTPVIGPSEPFD